MKKTIFVSGASGIVGYGTLKSLRLRKEKYKLIGSSIYDDSVAPAFCDIFEKAPLSTDSNYINWLCDLILRHNVNMIIPGINDDMLLWNEHRKLLEQTGAFIMLNNSNLIELCADKWKFYDYLRKKNANYLIDSRLEGTFTELRKEFGLPFLLKPRRGFASKGIVIVDSEDVFNKHRADMGSILIAQPIVGNNENEYTISAFFDRESKIHCLMSLRRKLSKEGFTEKAEVAVPPHAVQVIKDMASILLPIGPTNFQFRVHNGELKLLEINPRISSATSIRAAFGYNESTMAVDYFLDNIVPSQPKVLKGYAVRYTEDYIFYDSNTV